MSRLSLLMRYSIDTLQRRRVSIRSWSFSRAIALGAIRIPTRGPSKKNPKPSSVACAAGRDRGLLPVHLQLQPPFDHAADALEHPLSSPFAAHEDPQVVGVTDEPVTAFPQLPVQVIQHDVRQDRRQRRTLRGPLRRRLLDP